MKSAAVRSLLLFMVSWFLVEKLIHYLSKSEIRFRMASFLFFTLRDAYENTMCTRIIKAQAILGLLDSFQELHLEW